MQWRHWSDSHLTHALHFFRYLYLTLLQCEYLVDLFVCLFICTILHIIWVHCETIDILLHTYMCELDWSALHRKRKRNKNTNKKGDEAKLLHAQPINNSLEFSMRYYWNVDQKCTSSATSFLTRAYWYNWRHLMSFHIDSTESTLANVMR